METRRPGEWDWVTGTDPHCMFDWIRGKSTERKRRLFACGCCRMVWDLLIDERSRHAVEVAERYADGEATDAELDEAAAVADGIHLDMGDKVRSLAACAAVRCAIGGVRPWLVDLAWADAALAIEGHAIETSWQGSPEEMAAELDSWAEAWGGSGVLTGWTDRDPAAEMANLLRCIVGNPFRPVAADSRWLTPTVVQLARGIYTERAFDRLPILADALQDDGCDNADVLNHCRDGGVHARGCWVVDLVLGKQ